MLQLKSGKKSKKLTGAVILYPVIILGMVILAASLYFSWLASFSLKNEISYRKSSQARYLADTCAELALQQIWNNASYSGSGNFSGFSGSCTYTVTVGSGEARTINATGTIGSLTRKNKISIDQVNSKVNVSSWREVADF